MKGVDGDPRLIEIIFESAVLEGPAQETYLEGVARTNPALAAEARRRLAAAEDLTERFLGTPAVYHLMQTRGRLTAEPETADSAATLSAAALPSGRARRWSSSRSPSH